MMIKKRLIISNILMLLVPAILIVVIAVGVLVGFTKVYGRNIESLNKKSKASYIHRLINTYAKDLKNGNVKDEENNNFRKSIQDLNYDLMIESDGETIFSSFTDKDKSSILNLQSDIIYSEGSIVLEVNTISLVKETVISDGKIINIIAVKSKETENKNHMKAEVREFLTSYMGIVIVTALLIIILTNGVLSSRLTKSIIRPVELLSYGAGQIEDGNLDFKINYEGNDEFTKVCSDFDKMRLRLQKSVKIQLEYEEYKKELVAGISHDLRTPLTTIKGYIKGLKDGVANTPEKRERYHEIIYKKTCDMDMLVDKLFLFSNLDTDNFKFNFKKVNSNDFFRKIFTHALVEFKRKNLNINYENNCDDNILINIDCKEIERVISNILENSAKYKTEEFGNVDIIISNKSDNIILNIKDDGPGVLEGNLSRLFINFYREDKARTNTSENSGLGLSISEYIVKAHGGTILAENDNGLAIIITLPINK